MRMYPGSTPLLYKPLHKAASNFCSLCSSRPASSMAPVHAQAPTHGAAPASLQLQESPVLERLSLS